MGHLRTETRVRLDEDVLEKYTHWAQGLGISREWIINHVLRTIARKAMITDFEGIPKRRLVIKKTSFDGNMT